MSKYVIRHIVVKNKDGAELRDEHVSRWITHVTHATFDLTLPISREFRFLPYCADTSDNSGMTTALAR